MINRLYAVFVAFWFMPVSAYAAEELPPKGLERIRWAAECSGEMPQKMVSGFIILAVIIVAMIVYAKILKKGDGHE